MLKTKPLTMLTASDLMSENLLLIPQEMTLKAAAHWLETNGVSGAPVVDDEGRCIGVISASNFMQWAGRRDSWCDAPVISQPWQIVEASQAPTEIVRRYMTADPVMAAPATSIAEVARKMIDAHIHRVIVVDPQGHPIGIVASTDILAAVAAHSDDEDELAQPRCPHSLSY